MNPAKLKSCDVIWDSPSADASGSMPLGNGEIGINLWVEPNGDLVLYLARGDAWDHAARLLKVGRVRVRLTPALVRPLQPFSQQLSLRDGAILIRSGSPGREVRLRVWVDAHAPVIRVEVESDYPVGLMARTEIWRTQERRLQHEETGSAYGLNGAPEFLVSMPDSLVADSGESVLWYHHNTSSCREALLRQQSLVDMPGLPADPLLDRIFGAALWGGGLQTVAPGVLQAESPAQRHQLTVTLLTLQPATPAQWQMEITGLTKKLATVDWATAWEAHQERWGNFWERSYVFADGCEAARVVTRGYTLQRFINACAGRGRYPIKFNGSLFTVEPGTLHHSAGTATLDADYRCWGGHYWHQNTRLTYWAMLAAGDFDLMSPFFRLYSDNLGMAEYRVRLCFGHTGAMFPETMTFFGTYAGDDFGWDRTGLKPGESPNPCIRLHFSGNLETLAMMLDFAMYTGDGAFVTRELLPFARGVLTFFDQHYLRDEKGLMRIEPSQALETWQDTVNPVPEIAGLRFCCEGLLRLPTGLVPAELLELAGRLLPQIPPLPFGRVDERSQRFVPEHLAAYAKPKIPLGEGGCPEAIAVPAPGTDSRRTLYPAEKIRGPISNWESPELYAVFPYRLLQVGRPELEAGRTAYALRKELVPLPWWYPLAFRTDYAGWIQDDVQAALLGLTDEAAKAVGERFATTNPHCRFPAFWGPNCDWVPDQDHGAVGMLAVQAMLVQEVDGTIQVLPAWPKDWNVEFKLHAPRNTVVEGIFQDGQWEHLDMTKNPRI